MQDLDFNKVIEEHKNAMAMTKNISDFHVNNMKAWPLIVFNDVDECKISYNFFDDKGNFVAGEVTYDFTFKKDPETKDIKTAKENLTTWTKSLFFKETNVIILKDGVDFE